MAHSSPEVPNTFVGCPFGFIIRPTGRFVLCVTVPSLEPFREYSRLNARMWLRWAEPEDTGLAGPRHELAMATSDDEETGAAWVVACSSELSLDPGIRDVFVLLQIQGVVEVFVAEPEEPDSVDAIDGARRVPWSAFKAAAEAGEPVCWLSCVHFPELADEPGLPSQFRYR